MNTTGKLFLALFGAAVLGSTLTVVANNYYATDENTDKNFVRTAVRVPNANTDFTVAAENTINTVVSIKTYASVRQQYNGNRYFDPFEFFFGPGNGNSPRRQQPQQPQSSGDNMQPLGLGSGVIISTDGYIVTNHHVIKGAEKVEVTLNSNEKYTAKVIGSDESTDLALLKKIIAKLVPLDSDEVKNPDVDGDGTEPNAADLALLKKIIAKLVVVEDEIDYEKPDVWTDPV